LIEAKFKVPVMINLRFGWIVRQVAAATVLRRNSQVFKIGPSAPVFW